MLIAKKAVELAKAYQPKLRDGIKVAVEMVNSVAKDEQDGDVDMKVEIAPNTENQTVQISHGEGSEERPILKTESKPTYGNPAEVSPLTLNKPSGNASTSNNLTGWSHAEKLNYAYGPDANDVLGRRGPWVKGHIIHHNLGGDGMDNNNLFIIDRSANATMTKAEGPVQSELNRLKNLNDSNDSDYNKVLYYSVSYDTWGSSEPLSAFAKSGIITYGTMDEDAANKSLKNVKFDSSEPSESSDNITIDMNGLGESNLIYFFKDKGMMPSYARYLAKILKTQRYSSFGDLMQDIIDSDNIEEHNSKGTLISESSILKQTKLLQPQLTSGLTFKLN